MVLFCTPLYIYITVFPLNLVRVSYKQSSFAQPEDMKGSWHTPQVILNPSTRKGWEFSFKNWPPCLRYPLNMGQGSISASRHASDIRIVLVGKWTKIHLKSNPWPSHYTDCPTYWATDRLATGIRTCQYVPSLMKFNINNQEIFSNKFNHTQ